MSNDGAVTTAPAAPGPEGAPVFDPDPDLVADVESNPFALEAFFTASISVRNADMPRNACCVGTPIAICLVPPTPLAQHAKE